jgi:hypothetical protein
MRVVFGAFSTSANLIAPLSRMVLPALSENELKKQCVTSKIERSKS